jgi:hypothetical protein
MKTRPFTQKMSAAAACAGRWTALTSFNQYAMIMAVAAFLSSTAAVLSPVGPTSKILSSAIFKGQKRNADSVIQVAFQCSPSNKVRHDHA